MSTANEETPSTVVGQAGMDVDSAGQQVTAVNEEALKDSETAAIAESGSNNDELSVVADVTEPEFTAASSGASSSSQGL